jgi:hypothetical protein
MYSSPGCYGYGMGFRFRRTWNIVPGVRFNLGLKSGSVSFGVRGLHYTVGTAGSRITAGLPGTGLSWTKKIGPALGSAPPQRLNRSRTYVQTTVAGARPQQSPQPQTYSSPIGGGAQPPRLLPHLQPKAGGAQIAQLNPVQTGGLPPTHARLFVPLWLVWAVLAVIGIAGLCMTASAIGKFFH